jgi:hypothetical protein
MLSRATGLVVSIAFANSLVFAQGFTGTISGTVTRRVWLRLTGRNGHG